MKQEIGRRTYKETGSLPMFLFHIPLELSWKHRVKHQTMVIYGFLFFFLTISLSTLYYIFILGYWGWSVLCLDMPGMSLIDSLISGTLCFFVKEISFLSFPIHQSKKQSILLICSLKLVCDSKTKSFRSNRMWKELKKICK